MTSENDLREALKRQEPPEGFTERTLARLRADVENSAASSPPRARDPRPTRAPAWAAAGVAATLAIAAGAVQIVNHQHDADARRAAEQLTLALRVTSDTLRGVETRVFLTSQRGENSHDHQPSR